MPERMMRMERFGSDAAAPVSSDLELPLLHVRFALRAESAGRLPPFLGSALRGAFGWALKRTTCVMHSRPCEGCPLEASCIFPTVFDSRPSGAGLLRGNEAAPRPYAFLVPSVTPRLVSPGDSLQIGLTLAGHAVEAEAYVRRALGEALRQGIGPDRVRLAIETTTTPPTPFAPCDGMSGGIPPATPSVPPMPPRVGLQLVTPLRLRRAGDLVTPDIFSPADLLTSLLRRVSLLCSYHAGGAPDLDFRALKTAAMELAWEEADLRWREVRRRSSRQKELLSMGGIVGEASLAGERLQPFWPFLWLGQWVGAGKGATMGLGQLRLAALPPAGA